MNKKKFEDDLYYYLIDFLYYNDFISCCDGFLTCECNGDVHNRFVHYYCLDDLLDICMNNEFEISTIDNNYEFDGDKITIKLRMIDLCSVTNDIDILYNHYLMMTRDQKLKELLGD